MAKIATAKKICSKCSEPAMDDRDICREHHAEQMRDYRAAENKKRDADSHQRGFEEGIKKCVEVLRTKLAGKAVDGYSAAYFLEKACLTSEAPGVAERQKLIDSMRPWH